MNTVASARSVGVIVPFYQRQSGLLRRAVESVAAQDGLSGVEVRVFVVDDESPFPPAEDLRGLIFPENMSIEVLAKRNGGAGSARNTGIERAIAVGCRYAAFLDSDDWWEPEHLAIALSALADGPLFFFGNSRHDDVLSFSYFSAMQARSPEPSGVIDGREAFSLLIRECFPHTSQVVYALAPLADIRFDETMRRTGEDHLFWLTVAARGASFAWSSHVLGHRGAGVSVYRSALGWDSPGFVDRLIDAYRFRDLVARSFKLAEPDAKVNSRLRQAAADEIAYALARSLVRSPRRTIALMATVAGGGRNAVAAVLSALPRLRTVRRQIAAS